MTSEARLRSRCNREPCAGRSDPYVAADQQALNIFARFRHYHPAVGLHLTVGNAKDVLEQVREQHVGLGLLVSCPRNTSYFVAIKMGRRQGGPSRTGEWREHI